MKKFLSIFAVIALTLTLASCSSDSDNSSDNNTGNSTDTTKPADEEIVIYSNSASDGRGEWITALAKENGFDINVINITGGDLSNKIISEKNNPVADMIFGLNSVEYEKLKAADVLVKYDAPTWSDKVDMTLGDKDGYYYPTVIQPLVGIVNNEIEAPKSWEELTNDEWKGKYNLFDLGGGTARSMLTAFLTPYIDENGKYNVSEEGWTLVEKLFSNKYQGTSDEDFVGNVISGDVPISQMWGSGVLSNEDQRDYKFNLIVPENGVAYVVEQTAIVKGTDNEAKVIEFINWFGSSEVQSAWSDEFGTIPANKDALDKSSQEVKDFMGKVHPLEIDWALANENLDQWVKEIELNYN